MDYQPIKSASRSFNPDPYYLIQENGAARRYVIWLREKTRIRTLLAGFINQAGSVVDVKIRDFKDPEDPVDYAGTVDRSELHRLMTEHEDVLFHNGMHDLLIRLPESDEYIVFDEHGLLFIYSHERYDELLTRLGASHRPNEALIYAFDHWHYCLPDGAEKLLAFVHDLGLQQEP